MNLHAAASNNPILVLTNLPDQHSAQELAHILISENLAVCVNILAPCTSVYRWHEKIEHGNEVPLLIKTTEQHYAALQEAICRHHPYELPEVIHVPITGGLPAYLEWLTGETII